MYIKQLNDTPNPLSEKIIQNGEQSFKLWLEFEETSPWDNIENDFANIGVNMLDGRRYGVNVWTFEVLRTIVQDNTQNGGNLNGSYEIPPDLFVKELTRNCIEQTIIDLLKCGELEEILNASIFGLEYSEPYQSALDLKESTIEALEYELKQELASDHELYNVTYDIIAKNNNNDNIILELENGQIAVVHLTWKASEEISGYPKMRIYRDKKDFWEKELKQGILEYKK